MRILAFFVAFFGAIVVPQLIGHGLAALYPPQPLLAEDEKALTAAGGAFADPQAVLGTSVRRELVRDARPIYPQALQDAETAQFGLTGTGASVLAARFANGDAAIRARQTFFRMMGKLQTERDEAGIVRFTWPQSGQAAAAVEVGRTFMLWVAKDGASLERLRAESQAIRVAAPVPRTGVAGMVDDVRTWPLSRALPILAVYGLFVAWIFLRLAPWATTVEPKAGARPARLEDLQQRLLEVRFAESPISIAAGPRPGQFTVDWKYADAKWADHARAHGVRKVHRLILELDAATHTVRGREFHSEFDWSAGLGGAALRWHASLEIRFFHYHHERVFGLQVGPDGRLKPVLSYAWTFNLAEMKNPVIHAVTASGWRWRQVFFFAPRWLKWLHN